RTRLERGPEALTLTVDGDANARRAGLTYEVAVPLVGRSSREGPADRQPGHSVEHGGDAGDELDPAGHRNDRTSLLELGPAPRLPIGHGEGRAGLAVRPDEHARDTLGRELLLEPLPGMTPHDRRRGDVGAEGTGGASDVEALAAGDL